uniref:Uncharacterized protein n=1 Tax=Electric ant polycipivirus 2 TaxID=3003606 RepID=A0AA95E4F0_9VIRU|nr:hypothetical protein [Electric ant polycipivirus 2]
MPSSIPFLLDPPPQGLAIAQECLSLLLLMVQLSLTCLSLAFRTFTTLSVLIGTRLKPKLLQMLSREVLLPQFQQDLPPHQRASQQDFQQHLLRLEWPHMFRNKSARE